MREAKRRGTSGLSRRHVQESPADTDTHLNKTRHPAEFNKKQGYALGILVLLVLGIPFVGWITTGPLLHSSTINDPYLTLLSIAAPNNDLSGFNTFSGNNGGKVVYKSNCISTSPCLDMGSDSSSTSIALTKTSQEFSSISAKTLQYILNWETTAQTFPVGTSWGMYLTINGTVPTHDIGSTSAYNPRDDPSVGLALRFFCTSTCGVAGSTVMGQNLYALKTLGQNDTMAKEDSGCPSGSPFMCGTAILDPGTNLLTSAFWLNYTGPGNGGACGTFNGGNSPPFSGSGCSFMDFQTGSASQIASSQTFPWFNFQSQQYYVGFWVEPNLSQEVYFAFDTGSFANVFQIYTNTGITIAPNLDTGGLFGPIIKALINLGIWILREILVSFTFVVSVIVTAFNVIGNFLGLGPLGNDLSNFFGGIASWLTNVFGGIIGQIGNIASGIGSGVTSIINLFTDFGAQAISFLSTITGLPALILVLWNDFLPVAYAISFVVLLWMLFGFYQAWRDWNSGDIVGFLMCILMFGGIILILGSATAINPIAANTTVQGIYAAGFTNIAWFFALLMPIFLVQIFMHFGSDSESRGNRGHTTLQHWQSWAHTTEFFGAKLFHVAFIISKESWGVLLTIKQAIFGWF